MAVVQLGLAISRPAPIAAGVHLRHHQRDVVLEPQGGGVVHHRHAGRGQRPGMRLGEVAGDGEQREVQAPGRLEAVFLDGDLAEGRFLLGAGAAGGGEETQFRDREVTLVQHLHQFLADRARGSDHANPHDTFISCDDAAD